MSGIGVILSNTDKYLRTVYDTLKIDEFLSQKGRILMNTH